MHLSGFLAARKNEIAVSGQETEEDIRERNLLIAAANIIKSSQDDLLLRYGQSPARTEAALRMLASAA
jgi:hypothetical protein